MQGGQGKHGKSAPRAGRHAAPTGRRAALTPEAIVAAAIGIADDRGLEAVSIRGIASELEARPMSLYNHFDSKEDLLAAMSDEVSGEVLVDPPLPEHWREAMTAIARRLYTVLISHPWLVSVYGRQPRFGPNATKVARQMAEAVASLPLEQAEIWTMQGTVNDYVLGHSLRAVSAPRTEDLDDVIPESDLAESPELSALPKWLRSRATVERFESGLQIVLDGVERRLAGRA